ncbi:hypothetical protein CPB83DRAFT_760197 [Crepidotus variabilis]|uniref:Myb-like domain-containing protein n=1 Tax=Crepidotus variabilis TaxID=179855 RepID=A0A9P6JTU3_9AGAR|nr:hypothetical protein CPB83DRAFT_760197 [Crepidotus variabilis]
MASICADTGQGRISSKALEILNNHATWKVRNKEKRARMKAIMEARKYGRNEEDVDTDVDAAGGSSEQDRQGENATSPPILSTVDKSAGPSTTVDTPQRPGPVDESGSGFDYSENMATSRYNVQVRVGPNGEMIIDEESLLVDRVENDDTENYTHVTESDYTKFVNSATYGKRFRGSRWSADETELFFEALSQYGENYELIACVLPGRDRKACKNKFKSEDKKNPARINYCLNNSIPVDMKTLSRMTGKDFSGPVPEITGPPPPPAPQLDPPAIPDNATQNETPRSEPEILPTKKRSRSKSSGGTDGDVVIIGQADGFNA